MDQIISQLARELSVGVHQDGLVHISQVADRFIKHPSEVDGKKKHSLSMKQAKGN